MDKESRQLLQEIDCNCNDCGFFVRDFDALNASKALWRKNDARSIHSVRRHYWDEAQKALEKGRTESYQALLKERSRVTVDKSYKTGTGVDWGSGPAIDPMERLHEERKLKLRMQKALSEVASAALEMKRKDVPIDQALLEYLRQHSRLWIACSQWSSVDRSGSECRS